MRVMRAVFQVYHEIDYLVCVREVNDSEPLAYEHDNYGKILKTVDTLNQALELVAEYGKPYNAFAVFV